MELYPYWNQTQIADDFGNLIEAPNFFTKLWAIATFYSTEEY